MNLGLGTVQFGLNYGISNHEGQTSPEEVARILEVAGKNGITLIDTAAQYGTSEEALGHFLTSEHGFRIVTKTIRLDSSRVTGADVDRLERAFITSLEKLRCVSVYGLMIHNADDLLAPGGEKLLESLMCLRQNGLVDKIGVSVYTEAQIDGILAHFDIDLIQLPLNILDQRLLASGHLAALKSRGIEIHVRSAFLQGLLLMVPEVLPDFVSPARKHLQLYHAFLGTIGITPVRAALGFLAGIDEIDVVVCGVNNHYQLAELCSSAEPLPGIDFSQFALDDADLLNPSHWRFA